MFKRRIEYLLARILSVINILIPKDGYLIVFYHTAESFGDNTEAIYNYISKKDRQNKYKKEVLLPMINKRHTKIYCAWRYMRARYVFFSYGDTKIRPTKNQIVINQWHGSPLKTVGKLTKDKSFSREKLDSFTYLLSSSELFIKPLAKAFGCEEEKVKIVGQARNDYLFGKERSLYFENTLKGSEYAKTVLWMPTFRVSKDSRFVDSSAVNEETLLPIFSKFKELDKLNAFLAKNNVLMVIKIHHYANFKSQEYSNIKYVTNDDLEKTKTKLYSFVKDFDSLVTDYSSIFPDYILLDRPIGFTVDDYEIYKKERGFSIKDPIQYMAGNQIKNIDDFYGYIDDLVYGKDKYKNERGRVNKIMNKYGNGNCERLCKLAGIKFDQ